MDVVKGPGLSDPVFPAGLVLPLDYRDFDEFSAASPRWTQRHVQLGKGPARIHGVAVHTARLQLALVSREPGVLTEGATPPGTVVLGLTLGCEPPLLQRTPWDESRVGVLPGGEQYEVRSPRPHRVLLASVEQGLLVRHAIATWGRPLDLRREGSWLNPAGGERRRRLVATWARWLARTRRHPEWLTDPAASARFEDEVVGALFSAARPETPPSPAVRPSARLARRAEEYLRDHIGERPSIGEVCLAMGVPARTLHDSFRKTFDLTPKAYAKTLRLNAARRDLRAAPAGTTVSEVAVRWGFFQLGYFSLDYRRLFGESPSVTLRRALGK